MQGRSIVAAAVKLGGLGRHLPFPASTTAGQSNSLDVRCAPFGSASTTVRVADGSGTPTATRRPRWTRWGVGVSIYDPEAGTCRCSLRPTWTARRRSTPWGGLARARQ
jgi:hypothetical protein